MGTFRDFESIIRNMGELPPSPIVVTRLLDLLRKPDLKIKELAKAVSFDPVISARVLKMANSTFFEQQRQINSVDRAIIVIGENALKNLAMEYSLRSAHKTYGVLERRIWENSIGCAVACRMIAERFTDLDKSEAYLAGLQHHIGKVVMINRDKELYKEVMRIVEAGKGELRDVERGLFAYSHEMVGAALLDYWNYPETIVKATYHHHDFERLHDQNETVYKLCAVICLASGFCRHYGIGMSQSDEEYNLVMNPGSLALAANPYFLDELLKRFHPEFIRERNLFLA